MKEILQNMKWRAVLGLVLVVVAVVMSWNWVWGVLFLIWVIPDMFRGETHFLEPVFAAENPILFWAICFTWLGLSAYVIVYDILIFFGS